MTLIYNIFMDKIGKNFDGWNEVKKYIETSHQSVYSYPGEIWWCSIGINIGVEADGKNDKFERPVLIIKVYNKDTLIILPTTSRAKNDIFHHKIVSRGKNMWVKLTQSRVISSKRLIRKMDTLDENTFNNLKSIWKNGL